MSMDNDSSSSDISFTGSHLKKITLEKNKFQVKRAQSLKNIETFWGEQAENLVWNRHWNKTLEWNPPFAKWFIGGLLNASINCLDKHINSEIKNKAAIIWEGENGENITITYYQLYQKVNQFSNALQNLGIRKGDRVTIYLPMVPELPIAILACSRIGAIHNVVFSGFSSTALMDRINDAESKVIITADGGFRRGKIIELKKIVDEAIIKTPSIQNVVVLRRTGKHIEMTNKDLWWDDIIHNQSNYCEPTLVESTHPLYIVYAPLMHGVTEILFEGTPDYPQPDRYWSLVEKYGITILYTTPTALRMYRKYGNKIPNSFNLSTLRLLGTVGESIDPEVWMWYFTTIGKEKCPIVDTWWQTETGGIMISHCTGIDIMPMKPGSGMFPVPGVDLGIVNDEGNTLLQNQKGYLVIKKPWPGMLMTLWKDEEKYKNNYWKFHKDYYYFATGDYAIIDDDFYLWLLGRSDDVIKISGHRISTIELEGTFISHMSVSEAAVTSKPDKIKGESIVAFLVLKKDCVESDQLRKEIIEHIRKNIGAIATPNEIYFVNKLPKTRSGKIMRRLLKSIASGLTVGDTTTLEDETSIEEIQKIYNELNGIAKIS